MLILIIIIQVKIRIENLCPQLPMVVCIESCLGGLNLYVPSNLQRSLACKNLKNWTFGKTTIGLGNDFCWLKREVTYLSSWWFQPI